MPFESKLVPGQPVQAHGRTVTPLVHISTWHAAYGGPGALGGAVRLRARPVAVLERVGEQERRVPISNPMATRLRQLILVAAVVFLASRVIGRKIKLTGGLEDG